MVDARRARTVPSTSSKITGDEWTELDATGLEHEAVAFYDIDLCEGRISASTFTDCTF